VGDGACAARAEAPTHLRGAPKIAIAITSQEEGVCENGKSSETQGNAFLKDSFEKFKQKKIDKYDKKYLTK